MRILIIGNGFDLAHGLPTTYKNFLDTISNLEFIVNSKNKNEVMDFRKLKLRINNDALCKLIQKNYDNIIKNENIKEIIELFKDNIWEEYFVDLKGTNPNWVDLEDAILKMIQYIEYCKRISKEKDNTDFIYQYKHLIEILMKLNNIYNWGIEERYRTSINELLSNNRFFSIVIKELNNGLNKIVRCLELYLIEFAEEVLKLKKPVLKKIPQISDISAQKVLTFNYTNVYEEIYGNRYIEHIKQDCIHNYIHKMVSFNFIHGKAQKHSTIDKNNMVLGISDYLNNDETMNNIDFISFKKYFQRILKKTGCEYKNWLKEDEVKQVYIYGHSLDISDKDVLKEIIETSDTTTTIYHHNKEAFYQQLLNLVKILGRDELIKRTSNKTLILESINELK